MPLLNHAAASAIDTWLVEILQAVKEGRQRFVFMGQDIRLVASCGIFVTMNPGYAGRSELPDNLKALLRPVSMMVPDFAMIAEISMFSEGFASAKVILPFSCDMYVVYMSPYS